MHVFDRQTDGQTDGQTDVDGKTVRMLCSRMVKIRQLAVKVTSLPALMHCRHCFKLVHHHDKALHKYRLLYFTLHTLWNVWVKPAQEEWGFHQAASSWTSVLEWVPAQRSVAETTCHVPVTTSVKCWGSQPVGATLHYSIPTSLLAATYDLVHTVHHQQS